MVQFPACSPSEGWEPPLWPSLHSRAWNTCQTAHRQQVPTGYWVLNAHAGLMADIMSRSMQGPSQTPNPYFSDAVPESRPGQAQNQHMTGEVCSLGWGKGEPRRKRGSQPPSSHSLVYRWICLGQRVILKLYSQANAYV